MHSFFFVQCVQTHTYGLVYNQCSALSLHGMIILKKCASIYHTAHHIQQNESYKGQPGPAGGGDEG